MGRKKLSLEDRKDIRRRNAANLPCRHCGKRRANRPRGLCWGCYYRPGLREQYLYASEFVRRGVGINTAHGYTQPQAPTDHPPGSEGKVDVLSQRASQGTSLWHPDDAPIDPESATLGAAGRRSQARSLAAREHGRSKHLEGYVKITVEAEGGGVLSTFYCNPNSESTMSTEQERIEQIKQRYQARKAEVSGDPARRLPTPGGDGNIEKSRRALPSCADGKGRLEQQRQVMRGLGLDATFDQFKAACAAAGVDCNYDSFRNRRKELMLNGKSKPARKKAREAEPGELGGGLLVPAREVGPFLAACRKLGGLAVVRQLLDELATWQEGSR